MNVLTPRPRLSISAKQAATGGVVESCASSPVPPGSRQGDQASKNTASTRNSVQRRRAAQPRPRDAEEAAPSPPQQQATWQELQAALKLDVEMHVSKITLSPKSDKHPSRRPNTAPPPPKSKSTRPAEDQKEERNGGALFQAPCGPVPNLRRWKKRTDGSW